MKIVFKWIRDRWTALLQMGSYPDDLKERQNIKAHILGAGAGSAMRVENGAVKIEVKDDGQATK